MKRVICIIAVLCMCISGCVTNGDGSQSLDTEQIIAGVTVLATIAPILIELGHNIGDLFVDADTKPSKREVRLQAIADLYQIHKDKLGLPADQLATIDAMIPLLTGAE